MKAIHLMRQMMKYYRDIKKDFQMVFVDLGKSIRQGTKRSTLVGNNKERDSQEIY